jgi:hypothetical protein
MGATWHAVGGNYLIARQTLAAQRRAGADFASAWGLALKMTHPDDRGILQETRVCWERAYNRQSLYSDKAFSTLAHVTDGDTQTRITGQLVM